MKQILGIILLFCLLSCGANNNSKSGTRDTVVIIQQAPISIPNETKQPVEETKKKKSTNKESLIQIDTTTTVVYEPNENSIIVGFSESAIIGTKEIQLQTYSTDCQHAGKGDIRNEMWTFTKKGDAYYLTVKSDIKTIENYTGKLQGEKITMKGTYRNYLTGFTSKATLTLEFDGETKISGERRVITENSDNTACEIYQMVLEISK